MGNNFEIAVRDGSARCGTFQTAHGAFETPNFMPVGTRASVRGVDVERLTECGAQIMLVNTYHLWLRPGSKLIERLGGIHKFSGWPGPILSDSGGFQVYSLQKFTKLSEEGVTFRSYLDGSTRTLTPEGAVSIQEELGVDIAMVFDECPAAGLSYQEVERSLQLTLRWAKRCLVARKREGTSLFAITQGSTFRDLRGVAADVLGESDFDGYAIGGLSVGEPKEKMYDVLSYHPEQLPSNKVRYLMGVGTPQDIVEAVFRGVDLFDCVIPTRCGRSGRAYVRGAKPYLNLKNARFYEENIPLDHSCNCLCCRRYSRSYLHHLFRNNEMLGPQLLSIHNLTHYMDLMAALRAAIREKRMENFYRAEMSRWSGGCG